MNQYIENKQKRYDALKKSWCFSNNLIGLVDIELNVTELCSRHCTFCPRSDRNVYKNQNLNMSMETIVAFAEKCESEKYVGDVNIAGFGEPMLHPNLPEIVRTLRRHLKSYITVITNGDFLTKDSLKDLISVGLSRIVVSCYDGIEYKMKFEKLLEGCGIDYYIRELWGDSDTVIENNHFNSRTGLVPVPAKMKPGKQCSIPFYRMMFDWSGDVILCSEDWHRKEKGLGNINESSLKSLWFGNKLNSIRTNLHAGNRCGNACKDCSVQGTLVGTESFDFLSLRLGIAE